MFRRQTRGTRASRRIRIVEIRIRRRERRDEFAVREDGVEPSVRAGRHRPRTIPNPRRRRGAPAVNRDDDEKGETRGDERDPSDAEVRYRPTSSAWAKSSAKSSVTSWASRASSRAIAFHRYRVARIRAAGDATKRPNTRRLAAPRRQSRGRHRERVTPSRRSRGVRRRRARSPRRVIVRRPDAWTATVSTAPRATSCGSNSA